MCGIAGIHIKRPGVIDGHKLERLVNHLLLGIEHRGQDATGIAATSVGGKRVLMAKEPLPASEFIRRRPSLDTGEGGGDIRTIILHTRFATQGEPDKNVNNHPVLRGTTFVTHNGHINNDGSLFREHDMQRVGEVDSEIIPALIDKFGMDKVHLALQELDGGFAIAAINPTAFPDQLILAKGRNSPLFLIENDKFIIWASTVQTIKDAWGATFGTPPRDYKFASLSEGDILYIEGAESELLGFEVKESWTRTNSTTYNYTTYNYTKLTDEQKSEVCLSCGCTRFWHTGVDYTSHCVAKEVSAGSTYMCRCEGFVGVKVAKSVIDEDDDDLSNAHTQCDSCTEWSPYRELTLVYENYMVCDHCYPSYSDDADDRTGVIFDTHTQVSSCEIETGRPHLELVTGDRLGMSETDQERANRYADEIIKGDQRPMAIGEMLDWHNHILTQVSETLGYTPEFVEWILFRAPLNVVEGDTWLTEARSECDTAYADAEEELRQWEVEIGVDETPKGVVALIARKILH